jgi:hypothetical protein
MARTVGLRSWLARSLPGPARTGHRYGSKRLVSYIDSVAASIVACSGKKAIREASGNEEMIFESLSEMIRAGFEPFETNPVRFFAPSIRAVRKHTERADRKFLENVLLRATVLLCVYFEDVVFSDLKSEDAIKFLVAAESFIARRLRLQPQELGQLMKDFASHMLSSGSKRWLNGESPGKGDSLGLLLNSARVSRDGGTLYAFVVGAERSSGCAPRVALALGQITDQVRTLGAALGDRADQR